MDFNQIEQKILDFWEKNKIFEKSLRKNKSKKNFVFFEGPPTANGRPAIHHVESRSFKDVIPRYKTMRGFFVDRKAGWDTHGLPVEIEVEKQLGLKDKKEVELYGIAKFNEKCKESVWRYKDEWEKLTKRIGFWLDMENPYVTYENSYIESVWFILKKVWEKGLMYKGFKVVPHCPRCVTTLSSHEVAQGYKTIKESSIFVKFRIKEKIHPRLPCYARRCGQATPPLEKEGGKDCYFLVWTTTPWTLPANVALAINPSIGYEVLKSLASGEDLIVAENLANKFLSSPTKGESYDIAHTGKIIKGKDLIGIKYDSLYKNPNQKETDLRVVAGDFVSTEEGTGIVHIASAYGEDDLNVGQKENLSVIHTIDQRGIVLTGLGIPGEGKFVKEADKDIVKDLKKRNLLFGEKIYEHEYPFCWRCDSPLLYYAKESWFIRMSDLRNKLIANSKKINWEPAYIKDGRFGEFIKDVKDWAISRERFWGTPLPIWKCQQCGGLEGVGSIKELKDKTVRSGNKFFLMRHGQAESNVKNIVSSSIKDNHSSLTKKGEKEVIAAAKKLKSKKIDLIFSSDFLRTKQTAELAAKTIGLDKEKIIYDPRIREVNTGIFNGKSPKEYHAYFAQSANQGSATRPGREAGSYFSSMLEKFSKIPPQGENLTQLKNRVTEFLEEADRKYQGKNILVVSHEYSIWMMTAGAKGLDGKGAIELRGKKADFPKTAEIVELEFVSFPRDKNFILDLHRPYVDGIKLKCKCGGEMLREPDVIDVWLDSGAMPFAQWGYPNSKGSKEKFKARYPGDYIAEGIDQTRGWFYTLLAVSTLMEHCGVVRNGTCYQNVICLGLVLDKFGKKMSKSRGNIVDPWEMCEKFGADTVRWYFYTVNQAGDPKKFDIKDLQDKNRRVFGTLYNSLVFFQTYVDKRFKPACNALRSNAGRPSNKFTPKNLLDQWIVSRFNHLNDQVIDNLEKYDIVSAARLIEDFVDDLSNWYIRRSRERFQSPETAKEKEEASQTLYFVLLNLAKLMAPFVPFIVENIFQQLTVNSKQITKRDESVHLCEYPKSNKRLVDKRLEDSMGQAREIVNLALGERMERGIKVRQPLLELGIRNQELGKNKELLELIKDEVNVKSVVVNKTQKEDIVLNMEITPKLKEEGVAREIVRQIQQMRKEAGLVPSDIIAVNFQFSRLPSACAEGAGGQAIFNFQLKELFKNWAEYIKKETNAKSQVPGGEMEKFDLEKEIDLDGQRIKILIRKNQKSD